MSTGLLTAGSGQGWENDLVAALDRPGSSMTVLRRCVDIGDVLAVATTGQAAVAIVSADLRRLDTEAVTRLRTSGVAVVGVHPAGDDRARDRLERIGITAVVPDDAGTDAVLTAVRGAITDLATWNEPARGLSDPADRIAAARAASSMSRSWTARSAEGRWLPSGDPPARRAGPRWRPASPSRRRQLGLPTLLIDADVYGGVRGLRVRPARRITRSGRGVPAGSQRPVGPRVVDLAVLVARRRPAAADRDRPRRSVAGGAAVGDSRRARRRQGNGAADRRRLRLLRWRPTRRSPSTRWRRGETGRPWPCWPKPMWCWPSDRATRPVSSG